MIRVFILVIETRQSSLPSERTCFFCDSPSTTKNPLHLVQSFRLDRCVRRCANLLKDNLLHAKLQNGDMIAQDAMYHKSCLNNLYKKESEKQLEGHYSDEERKLHGIAFGEIISFIEESVTEAIDNIPIFKLSDLIKMYNSRLKELGIHLETRIHSTRFKERLLSQFEDMSAYNEKKEVILAFNYDIGEFIATSAKSNYDDDGYILAKAASILRK